MKARTEAACDTSAIDDLFASIWAMRGAYLPPVSRPVDVTDEQAFPNIAEAVRHLASLSPERRAELENGL